MDKSAFLYFLLKIFLCAINVFKINGIFRIRIWIFSCASISEKFYTGRNVSKCCVPNGCKKCPALRLVNVRAQIFFLLIRKLWFGRMALKLLSFQRESVMSNNENKIPE